MNPDDTQISLWIEGELDSETMHAMDMWAADKPDQLAARKAFLEYKNMLSEIPAEEEIPYPDFFMTKMHQRIAVEQNVEQVNIKPVKTDAKTLPFWQRWLLPIAATVAVVAAFSIGRNTARHEMTLTDDPVQQLAPLVYTPQDGVYAKLITDSSLIVLEGIAPIPDSIDFSRTVYVPSPSETNRMAANPAPNTNTRNQ